MKVLMIADKTLLCTEISENKKNLQNEEYKKEWSVHISRLSADRTVRIALEKSAVGHSGQSQPRKRCGKTTCTYYRQEDNK